jgi:hypothetical protein
MLVELLIIKGLALFVELTKLLEPFVELVTLLELFVELVTLLEVFEGGGNILAKVTLSINGEN